MAHDLWFFFLASAQGGIVSLDQRLVAYRQHEANVFGYRGVSRIGTWVRGLRGRETKFNLHAAAAVCCERVLATVAAKLDPSVVPQVLATAGVYRNLAEICRLRAALYASPHLRERMATWRQLLRSGSYRKTDWTAAPVAAYLEDLGLGVPFGPAVTRFGDSVRSALQAYGSSRFRFRART